MYFGKSFCQIISLQIDLRPWNRLQTFIHFIAPNKQAQQSTDLVFNGHHHCTILYEKYIPYPDPLTVQGHLMSLTPLSESDQPQAV